MAESIATIVLWLFVIDLGIAFGAGLYESRIVVPQWLSSSPESGYRMTFAYFIPTMLKLIRNKTSQESEAVAKASQWVNLGFVRHAATLVAWFAALMAFWLMGKHGD